MSGFTLAAPVGAETIVRKSRFIARVTPVADRAAALLLVQAERIAHPNATHVCWALLAGGDSAANDDGEPGGTAGRPMLEVLRLQALDGVLATVVRYFGGVKLGAGGLTRAYGGAVAEALRGAEKVPRVPLRTLAFMIPYSLEGRVRHLLSEYEAADLVITHDSLVRVQVMVRAPAAQALIAALEQAGAGQLGWLPTQPTSTRQ
ncbi:MAG: YigZ family protein [Burkholderiaceae bacterium]